MNIDDIYKIWLHFEVVWSHFETQLLAKFFLSKSLAVKF